MRPACGDGSTIERLLLALPTRGGREAPGLVLVEHRPVRDNLDQPHAFVVARTFEMDAESIEAIRDSILSSRAGRIVEGVVHVEPGDPSDLPSGTVEASAYMAVPLDRLGAGRPVRDVPGLAVERVTDLAFHDEYVVEYEAWWAEAPHLEDRVRVESREHFASHLARGIVGLVRLEGRIAGVLAAVREREFGLEGWCMRERFLYRAMRGRGFGETVLLRFARLLARRRSCGGTSRAGTSPLCERPAASAAAASRRSAGRPADEEPSRRVPAPSRGVRPPLVGRTFVASTFTEPGMNARGTGDVDPAPCGWNARRAVVPRRARITRRGRARASAEGVRGVERIARGGGPRRRRSVA